MTTYTYPLDWGLWNNSDNTKQLIVVHTTESSNARNTADYLRRTQAGSYQELTDTNGDVYRMVPDNRQAWAAMGQGNRRGLHVCAVGYAAYRLPRIARAAARFTKDPCTVPRVFRLSPRKAAAKWASFPNLLESHAQTMARWSRTYGIPLVRLTAADVKAGRRGVCGHNEISLAFRESDHTDPGVGYPYARVIARAREINGGGNLLGMSDAELAEFADHFRQLGPS